MTPLRSDKGRAAAAATLSPVSADHEPAARGQANTPRALGPSRTTRVWFRSVDEAMLWFDAWTLDRFREYALALQHAIDRGELDDPEPAAVSAHLDRTRLESLEIRERLRRWLANGCVGDLDLT